MATTTDRYGSKSNRRSGRFLAVILGSMAILLGVGIAWIAYVQWGRSDLEGLVSGYKVDDDSTVTVRLSVTRDDPAKPAVCIVRGLTGDQAEVGRREILIEPSESKTVDISVAVKTSSRASTGTLYGCGWDVPEYLKPVS